MLLLEEAARQDVCPEIQLFASDLDAAALTTAREGSYPLAIQADVSEERLRRFFTREGDLPHQARGARPRCLRPAQPAERPALLPYRPDFLQEFADLPGPRTAGLGLHDVPLRLAAKRVPFRRIFLRGQRLRLLYSEKWTFDDRRVMTNPDSDQRSCFTHPRHLKRAPASCLIYAPQPTAPPSTRTAEKVRSKTRR